MHGPSTTNDLSSAIVSFIANVGINDQKADGIASELSDGVTKKRFKLLELVLALKESLLADEATQRKKAVACLSSVLAKLPEDQLLKNEVSVVFSFYSSKMDDTELSEETFFGLSSLARMKFISMDCTKELLVILSEKYKPTSFLAPVRYLALQCMLNVYVRNETKLISDLAFADSYVECFLHVANGEKDPRNLLISFKLNQNISSKLKNVGKYREELFDVLFCYFPITFKPPKNDPYKISNQDLKVALRHAISASSEFAEDAFGNLIDKLTASSFNVKNDTLLTLKECIDNFGGESLLKNWLPLWNALKFEIIHSNDVGELVIPEANGENTEVNNFQAALDVLRSCASQLIKFDEGAFNNFFSHIFEELKSNFAYDKDLRQSCSILASIGSANSATFDKVISNTLPLFLESTSEMAKLKLVMMNLSFFFDSYIAVFNDKSSVSGNRLIGFKDEILMILGKALTGTSKVETTIRTLAVVQFTKLVKMKDYLNRDEVALIIQYLTDTVLTDNNKNIYYACLEGLKTIGDVHEDLLYDVSLKRLLRLLPSEFVGKLEIQEEEPIEIENILKVILDFTNSKHRLIKESVIGLTSKINGAASDQKGNDYSFLLASSLYTLLANNISLIRDVDAAEIRDATEASLLELLTGDKRLLTDDHTLTLLSNALFFIELKTPIQTHQEQLNKFIEYFDNELGIFEKPNRSVLPFVKILGALNKQCHFEEASLLFSRTIRLIAEKNVSMDELERLGYLECLMVLANKWLEESSVSEILDYGNTSAANLEVLTWIGKGLIMKNSRVGAKIQGFLLRQLAKEDIGFFVAKLFEVFVIDITSLNRYKGVSWNCNTKLLYKQKFFSEMFPELINLYKESDDLSIKSNYLTALSLILKQIPSTIIEPYMSNLLPLLLQAVELPTVDVKISALSTLKETAEKFHQLVSEHAQTWFKTLLKLIVPGKYNNVQVRVLALELLLILSRVIPLNYSLPYKVDVIRALEPVLDDNKRIVRKQCVITRQAFFELGQVPFE